MEGLRILTREEALELEPALADSVYAALYAPTGGIVCPFLMNIAYAENAAINGCKVPIWNVCAGYTEMPSSKWI